MDANNYRQFYVSPSQTVFVEKVRFDAFYHRYFFEPNVNREEYLAQCIAQGWVIQ